MTEHNFTSFDELSQTVIEQLQEEHYMESTLTVYRRTYNRIKKFLLQQCADKYDADIGRRFMESQHVKNITLKAYKCAVRRLDDCISGKEYRCHHENEKETVCSEYSDILAMYLNHCIRNGNKPATLVHKRYACVGFLNFLKNNGCDRIEFVNSDLIVRALLTFENKDRYADVRMLLHFLFENEYINRNYSEIIPKNRKTIPIPTVYTIEEIKRIEGTFDLLSETGMRNICLIQLATRLGLRSGDIAKLKISEIDFTPKRIKIKQEKTGNSLVLEMPDEVLNSINKHLENRTKNHYIKDEYVFHTMSAPYGRLTTSIIRHVVNSSMQQAEININGRKHGPHAFRSSLASSMINDNTPYETVRKILGHSSPDVIKRYAKTDIENLRLCAIDPPEPTGLFMDFLSGKKVFQHV